MGRHLLFHFSWTPPMRAYYHCTLALSANLRPRLTHCRRLKPNCNVNGKHPPRLDLARSGRVGLCSIRPASDPEQTSPEARQAHCTQTEQALLAGPAKRDRGTMRLTRAGPRSATVIPSRSVRSRRGANDTRGGSFHTLLRTPG
jgi:hypothetical protein